MRFLPFIFSSVSVTSSLNPLSMNVLHTCSDHPEVYFISTDWPLLDWECSISSPLITITELALNLPRKVFLPSFAFPAAFLHLLVCSGFELRSGLVFAGKLELRQLIKIYHVGDDQVAWQIGLAEILENFKEFCLICIWKWNSILETIRKTTFLIRGHFGVLSSAENTKDF